MTKKSVTPLDRITIKEYDGQEDYIHIFVPHPRDRRTNSTLFMDKKDLPELYEVMSKYLNIKNPVWVELTVENKERILPRGVYELFSSDCGTPMPYRIGGDDYTENKLFLLSGATHYRGPILPPEQGG